MFTDTHFHLHRLFELGCDCVELLSSCAIRNFPFLLDIGTDFDDLPVRLEISQKVLNKIHDESLKNKISSSLFFSAGLWPSPEAIKNRFYQMKELEKNIEKAESTGTKIIAIGECGLDHHWNIANPDKRNADDFTEELFQGESELFEMQLSFAKDKNLPVIVHSRDAFEGTLSCIKNVGYHNGVIHCYSYGLEESKEFLDLGWYIALGGGVTYTKKSRMEQMQNLIKFIPQDRLLLETDAPYLAPVPYRGQQNTPLLIESTYEFIAEILNISIEDLASLVIKNTKNLFLV